MNSLLRAISLLNSYTLEEVIVDLNLTRSRSSSASPRKTAHVETVSPVETAAAAAPAPATPVKAGGATALQPSLSPGDTDAGAADDADSDTFEWLAEWFNDPDPVNQ